MISVFAIQLFYRKTLRKYVVLLRVAEREHQQALICVSGLLIAIILQTNVNGASEEMIESLLVTAVLAFRILAGIAAVSSTLNLISGQMPSFNAAYENVKQVQEAEQEFSRKTQQEKPDETAERAAFKEEIKFNNVSYRYPNTDQYILRDIFFTVKANTSIGIVGPSGAGKSTLVDVLLGLVLSGQGNIAMDGEDI